MSERHNFCVLASQPRANISKLCREYGISRKTGYKWLSRWDGQDLSTIADRSRRPHRIRQRTDPAIIIELLEVRRAHPRWGARKLRAFLERQNRDVAYPPAITISRILSREGLTEVRERVDRAALQRFERSRPNELWQMDLKGNFRLHDGRKVYPIAIVDDHSRYLVSLDLIYDLQDLTTLAVWIAAARGYGLPDATLTDHGVQFRSEDHLTSKFRAYLWGCGVVHTQGRIAHPQTQGKIERLWRTLKDEVLSRYHYGDYESWRQCFSDWRREYNEIRPHESLGDLPPASRYSPSDRAYEEPDRLARIGQPDSQYRVVNRQGRINLSSSCHFVGRGLAGWCVELRPLGNGCWHVYLRGHFVKELLVTAPIPLSVSPALSPTASGRARPRGE